MFIWRLKMLQGNICITLRSFNAQILNHFPHSSASEQDDIIHGFVLPLFPDVPSCTTVFEHDVGDVMPTTQHAYWVNPEKHLQLGREVTYILKNGIAEPSTSTCSCRCIPVNNWQEWITGLIVFALQTL